MMPQVYRYASSWKKNWLNTSQFSLFLLSSVQFIISIKNTKSISNNKIIQNHKHRVEEMLQKAKAVLVIAPSYKENTEKQDKTRQDDTRQDKCGNLTEGEKHCFCTV